MCKRPAAYAAQHDRSTADRMTIADGGYSADWLVLFKYLQTGLLNELKFNRQDANEKIIFVPFYRMRWFICPFVFSLLQVNSKCTQSAAVVLIVGHDSNEVSKVHEHIFCHGSRSTLRAALHHATQFHIVIVHYMLRCHCLLHAVLTCWQLEQQSINWNSTAFMSLWIENNKNWQTMALLVADKVRVANKGVYKWL